MKNFKTCRNHLCQKRKKNNSLINILFILCVHHLVDFVNNAKTMNVHPFNLILYNICSYRVSNKHVCAFFGLFLSRVSRKSILFLYLISYRVSNKQVYASFYLILYRVSHKQAITNFISL